MKRSATLMQLSRDHHQALKLALTVRRLDSHPDDQQVRSLADEVGRMMAAELEPHFQQEEGGLLPALAALGDTGQLVARTLEDHRFLRQAAAELRRHPDRTLLLGFAERLQAHVRFEERELFVVAEERLNFD